MFEHYGKETYFCNFPRQGGFKHLKLFPVGSQQLKHITSYLGHGFVRKLEKETKPQTK